MTQEALKLALEALEEIALAGMSGTGQESERAMTEWHARQAWKFIGIAARQRTAIKEALREHAMREVQRLGQEIEQEPVAWMYQDKSTHEVRFQKHMRDFVDHGATYETPLYTPPPQRKPLTVVEIMREWHTANDSVVDFARAIEAAHGIGKNK